MKYAVKMFHLEVEAELKDILNYCINAAPATKQHVMKAWGEIWVCAFYTSIGRKVGWVQPQHSGG
jgi:hypothetical protein